MSNDRRQGERGREERPGRPTSTCLHAYIPVAIAPRARAAVSEPKGSLSVPRVPSRDERGCDLLALRSSTVVIPAFASCSDLHRHETAEAGAHQDIVGRAMLLRDLNGGLQITFELGLVVSSLRRAYAAIVVAEGQVATRRQQWSQVYPHLHRVAVHTKEDDRCCPCPGDFAAQRHVVVRSEVERPRLWRRGGGRLWGRGWRSRGVGLPAGAQQRERGEQAQDEQQAPQPGRARTFRWHGMARLRRQ